MPVLDKVDTPEKKGFMDNPSANRERIKRDEEELARLLAEQAGETDDDEDDDNTVDDTDESNLSAEEITFKKRYGDLRAHSQKVQRDLEERIAELEQQITQVTREGIDMPASDADIEAWMAQYPEVAAIVESIAHKKAVEQTATLGNQIEQLQEARRETARQKAEAALIKLHPDFNEIREDDDFHDWAEGQPKFIQDALYENDSDPITTARAIDLYKADRGITTVDKKKRAVKQPRAADAASAVNTKRERSRPQEESTEGVIRESDVNKMSMHEYEQMQPAIMEALKKGTFVYDLSGGAR